MPNLLSAVAIAEVFPEGQKTTAFVMEYDCAVTLPESGAKAFSVIDFSLEPQIPGVLRRITRVYTSSEAARSENGQPGRYLILETDTEQKEAYSIMPYDYKGNLNPFGPGDMCYQKPGEERKKGPGPKGKGGPGPHMDYTGPKPLRLKITQLEPLTTEDGTVIPPSEIWCTASLCPEVERFRLCRYEDLPYNLYIPDHYDPSGSYPLVLFIPDAAARGTDPRVPLIQGVGGVCWTSPEDQAKHPCFVVCPAFGPDEVLTQDDFTCLPKLYKMKGMLDEITASYSIDMDRIYTTGQSMGCMSSCELMITWPDYFAGALLVAGQWDPERCGKAMWNQNLWIVVSENDWKAHPGMDAVTDAITENGGKVARFLWNARAGEQALNTCVADAMLEPANVRYTLFEGYSVLPTEDPESGSTHLCTWRHAYSIPALRDWLFTLHK